MDKGKLEKELQTFCRACGNSGYPIRIKGISEAYPGVEGTSYTVHIKVSEWSLENSCSEILDKILPILYEVTTEEAREAIFSLDVYNEENGMNCNHMETFQEFVEVC